MYSREERRNHDTDFMRRQEVKIARLTGLEREVISLVSEGLKDKQIAEWLCVSESRVRHYLISIFNKLNISDRLELVIYAYLCGIAKRPLTFTSMKA